MCPNLAILTFVNFTVSIHKAASIIAASITHSKLDHCNSLCHNLPNSQINHIQYIHPSLARAVIKAPNPVMSHLFSDLLTGSKSRMYFLHMKLAQLLKPLTCMTWSLFNHLTVCTICLWSPLFDRQLATLWKAQIAHSNMHQSVSGIDFLIYFSSLFQAQLLHFHHTSHMLVHWLCHQNWNQSIAWKDSSP